MTASPRFQTNKPEELPQDLIQLGQLIDRLPPSMRDSIEPVYGRVVESTRRRRRILALVQEALSQLRLDMKYLVFDLEATRRERDTLRNQSTDEQGE